MESVLQFPIGNRFWPFAVSIVREYSTDVAMIVSGVVNLRKDRTQRM